MLYVFGYTFYYTTYKKDIDVKLFVDNFLVDHFILDKSQDIAKFYELDLKQKPDIKIKVTCEDSNYTNGFMTKSASYSFHKDGVLDGFMLCPKKCFSKNFFDKLRKKYWDTGLRKYGKQWLDPNFYADDYYVPVHFHNWITSRDVIVYLKNSKKQRIGLVNTLCQETATFTMPVTKKGNIFRFTTAQKQKFLKYRLSSIEYRWLELYNQSVKNHKY